MAENQYNSGSDGNDPRPILQRTRSVVGPRPLPSGQKEQRDGSQYHKKQYSTSSVSEYHSVPPQNSNPQNFIPSRIDMPDQPFPPLVSPKPQKPMPTVTNDIANVLETQYPESLNGYEIQTSDTPKSWYKGDDEKLNLASDQNQNSSTKENQKNEGTNKLPSHDNHIQNFQNISNQSYQYSSSPPQQFGQLPQQQQQQQQQVYYQKFSHQQNFNNFQQYQTMPPNSNFQNTRPINSPHQQSPQPSPSSSSIHSTPRQSFSQDVNSFQQAHNSQETIQEQYIQMQTGQQANYQNYGASSPMSISGSGSSNQINSASQISTSPQPFPSTPNKISYNDHSISPIQNAQGQFEYHRHGSPVGFPRQSSPIPPGTNRGSWSQRTPTPDRGHLRSQPNTSIRLLIDDKIARRMTMTSVTLANDENALQKYRDAAKKTNDPNVQVDYAKFLINMIECLDTSNRNKTNEQINNQEQYNKLVEEAFYWIDLLARKDNAEAMYIKGTWHEYGKFGKEIKLDKAFRLYLSASKQDFPKAIYKVAEHYEKNKDTKRALQFYKKAASQGDVPALYRLAMVHLLGHLKTEPDYSQALIYLKLAAAKANEECPDGAYVYGMILAKQWDKAEIPDQVVAPDDREAKEYIQKAANLGHVKALCKMGYCYEYAALGCQFDPILSVSYYKRAAEKDDPEADMALSKWYLCGAEGYFDQNEAAAYEHAERAAMKGLAAAEFAMGYFHEVGIHVPVNSTQANLWYTKAAESGNEDAKQRLARGGTITRRDHEQNKLKNEKNNKDCTIQ